MTHTAFFYGTLMAPQVLRRVCGMQNNEGLVIRPAILRKHQRHRVKHCDYPAVVPSADPKSCVRGSLVSGLSDADIYRLDIFEGSEYQRRKVIVSLIPDAQNKEKNKSEHEGKNGQGEEEVQAETYIWIAARSDLEPTEWDFDEFVREKMRNWVGQDAADEGFKGKQLKPVLQLQGLTCQPLMMLLLPKILREDEVQTATSQRHSRRTRRRPTRTF